MENNENNNLNQENRNFDPEKQAKADHNQPANNQEAADQQPNAEQADYQQPNYQQSDYQQPNYSQSDYTYVHQSQADNQQWNYQNANQSGYQQWNNQNSNQSGYQQWNNQNANQGGYQQWSNQNANQGGYQQAGYVKGPLGEVRSPMTTLLLTIITCGIYGIVWLYKVSKEINDYTQSELTNPSFAIIGIFCAVFTWIEVYKIDQALVQIDRVEGRQSESKFLIWILLSILVGFGFFMMIYQVQEQLNRIWVSNGSNAQYPSM